MEVHTCQAHVTLVYFQHYVCKIKNRRLINYHKNTK